MSGDVTCPECLTVAPLVAWCETCGETWDPGPLSPAELVAGMEAYLEANGWESRPGGYWELPGGLFRSIGNAIVIQLRADGVDVTR